MIFCRSPDRPGLNQGYSVNDATKMVANSEDDRFSGGAEKYAAYLESPEGRLRIDLAFASLQDFLPRTTRPLLALDLGGGTGAVAVSLARLGLHVTIVDTSLPMLDFAKRAAQQAGVSERIALKHADVTGLFAAGSFDVILCHNILEYLDDPAAVLYGAARRLRDSSSILSVLVRNRAGEVLKAAIQTGDLAAAERNLTSEWGEESLYGGKVRLFTSESLETMLKAASLETITERGVRVLADYLPARISRVSEYKKIFRLERELGRRPEFATVARYLHRLAHRSDRANEEDK